MAADATSRLKLFRAAWIAPMDRPPLENAAIGVAGERVIGVFKVSESAGQFLGAETIDLGDVIVLPGLVNAHVHLELSDLSPPERPRSLAEWIISLIKQTSGRGDAMVSSAVAAGVAQSLRFGVTTIGDVTAFPRVTRRILSAGPLCVVSFGEVRAMANRRGLLEGRVEDAADRSDVSERLSVGISPHAPYSLEIDGYRRCVEVARQRELPIMSHIAEAADEGMFLRSHQGSLRDIWNFLDGWDDRVPIFNDGPIHFAEATGLLNRSAAILAHVNYCDDEALSILSRGLASVVYCPRTHAYFGHPTHRWREMLSRGINVAIGTDSCASSPDLNLLEDLRLLHRIAPDMVVHALWELATTRAAAALSLANECGSISAGKRADFITFPIAGTNVRDPLAMILETSVLPVQVWISGRRIEMGS